MWDFNSDAGSPDFPKHTLQSWSKWDKKSPTTPLTFGIEMEFNVAIQGKQTPDPDPQDPRIIKWKGSDDDDLEATQKHICNTLQQKGIAARDYWDIEAEEKDEDWIIYQDETVSGYHHSYEFHGIEVKSPPFYYCQNSRLNVSAVAQILTNTYRLWCNETCGSHVHVGNARNRFHPRVLSNLAALLWTFEDRLSMLHSESRRTGRGKNYSKRLRDYSRLGLRVSATPEGTRLGLETLLAYKDEDTTFKVLDAIGGGKNRLAYNFIHLEGNDKTKRTIEFRQHEGTMSSERIVHWLNVCIGLVEFAEKVDSDELAEFLWSHFEDKNEEKTKDEKEEYTAIDLLKAIGRPAEAEFYEKSLLNAIILC